MLDIVEKFVEKETLLRRAAQLEREEEESKLGVPRRESGMCTAFGMMRTRH